MLFKNLICLQLTKPFNMTAQALEDELAKRALQPCPPTVPEVSGWVEVAEKAPLALGVEKYILLALGTEKRVLPGAVVADVVKEMIAEYENTNGHPPGKKLKKEMKEKVTEELLPKAFTFKKKVFAYLDLEAARFYVDAGSMKTAEDFALKLKETLAESNIEIAFQLLEPKTGPQEKMTTWVMGGAAHGEFELGEACQLMSADESKKTISYSHHPLTEGDELQRVKENIETGMSVSRLELVYKEQLSFTVNAKLEVKKIVLLDTKDEAPQGNGGSGAIDALMADFLLAAGTLRPVIAALEEAFEVAPPSDQSVSDKVKRATQED